MVHGVSEKEDILKVIIEYAMGVIVKCGNFDSNVEIIFESKFSLYYCRIVFMILMIIGSIESVFMVSSLVGKYGGGFLEIRNWKDCYFKHFCVKCVSNNLTKSD